MIVDLIAVLWNRSYANTQFAFDILYETVFETLVLWMLFVFQLLRT